MRLLVTGAGGYIGSHAVLALLQAGHEVTALDNFCNGFTKAIALGALTSRMDVGDGIRLSELLWERKIEAVLHFAAFAEVGESVLDPAKYYRNNFASGIALLDSMRAAKVSRLIFSSTAAVYGNPEKSPIPEDHPRLPINPYGRSKWMMEQAIADYSAAFGLSYACLRYFNVAGAASDGSIGEGHDPESHLIPRVLAAAANPKSSVSIFGTDYPTPDGTCIRDYVHVEDLIEAHRLALDALKPGQGQVYNVGSEKGFSVREVIDVCKKVTGCPITVEEKARRPGDPAILVAESVRIRRDLGWVPKFPDLPTMVRHAWAWKQGHPIGYPKTPTPV